MARNAATAPPEGNITEEARKGALDRLKPFWASLKTAKEAQRTAAGKYRAELKQLGEDGFDTDAMVVALKFMDMDEEERAEREKRMREAALFLKLEGIPVGTQLTMMDDLAPSMRDVSARAAGVQDGLDNVPQSANPMTKEEQRRAWNDGWLEGQEKFIKQQAKRAAKAAAAPTPPVDSPAASASQPDPENDARVAGRRAGRDGQPSLDNPHPHGSALRSEWEAGWKLGQEDLAFEGPAPATVGATAH